MNQPIIARLDRPGFAGGGKDEFIFLRMCVAAAKACPHTSSMVPVLLCGFSLGLGLMNGAIRMVGWGIDGIQLQPRGF